ncbi:MAG: hypothetical protein ACK56F_02300 [bacterium]
MVGARRSLLESTSGCCLKIPNKMDDQIKAHGRARSPQLSKEAIQRNDW